MKTAKDVAGPSKGRDRRSWGEVWGHSRLLAADSLKEEDRMCEVLIDGRSPRWVLRTDGPPRRGSSHGSREVMAGMAEVLAPEGKATMTPGDGRTVGARHRERNASDLLGSYLTEIGAYELLTAEEEVALARAITRGNEAVERLREGELEERQELEAAAEEGRRAQERFVRSNLRLVVSVARRYARGRMEMLDLIQEGNVGLMRAVERFDPERGFRFSTYATWWIRQSIRRAVAQTSSTIRIPEHVRGRLGRLRGAEEFLRSELGRNPSVCEIAGAAGLDIEEAEGLLDIPDSVSFETPVGEEGGSQLGDFLADDGSPSPSEPVLEASMQADVRTALATFRERDRRLLELRFGLEGGTRRTLEEIAKELGVSRQRVRQIEQRALAKLREAQLSRLESYA